MVKLPCPARDCAYETIEQETRADAKELLDIHVRIDHAATAVAGGDSHKKPEKFPRPEISLDKTAEDWSEFLVTWEQYKEEYGLSGSALIRQLYACCSDEMKTSLSRITGGQQFKKNEQELLTLMKELAVRYQNPMVHVQEFLQQVQSQDEGVRHFLTRLRGVAARCHFSEKCGECNHDVSYADSIIRFKLVSGLYDPEIKEDILSLEERTLDETVKTIEAKESGKLARQMVGAGAAPGKVSFLKPGPRIIPIPPNISDPVAYASTQVSQAKCSNCGRIGHTSQREDREKNCPAWDKICSACSRKGHFRGVCRNKAKPFVKPKKVAEVFK